MQSHTSGKRNTEGQGDTLLTSFFFFFFKSYLKISRKTEWNKVTKLDKTACRFLTLSCETPV